MSEACETSGEPLGFLVLISGNGRDDSRLLRIHGEIHVFETDVGRLRDCAHNLGQCGDVVGDVRGERKRAELVGQGALKCRGAEIAGGNGKEFRVETGSFQRDCGATGHGTRVRRHFGDSRVDVVVKSVHAALIRRAAIAGGGLSEFGAKKTRLQVGNIIVRKHDGEVDHMANLDFAGR